MKMIYQYNKILKMYINLFYWNVQYWEEIYMLIYWNNYKTTKFTSLENNDERTTHFMTSEIIFSSKSKSSFWNETWIDGHFTCFMILVRDAAFT